MIRRPPRSPLFPSTPLFRSRGAETIRALPQNRNRRRESAPIVCLESKQVRRLTSAATRRSEEHTSELQSQSNLVCRLLLEKKKHRLSLHWHAVERILSRDTT